MSQHIVNVPAEHAYADVRQWLRERRMPHAMIFPRGWSAGTIVGIYATGRGKVLTADPSPSSAFSVRLFDADDALLVKLTWG